MPTPILKPCDYCQKDFLAPADNFLYCLDCIAANPNKSVRLQRIQMRDEINRRQGTPAKKDLPRPSRVIHCTYCGGGKPLLSDLEGNGRAHKACLGVIMAAQEQMGGLPDRQFYWSWQLSRKR